MTSLRNLYISEIKYANHLTKLKLNNNLKYIENFLLRLGKIDKLLITDMSTFSEVKSGNIVALRIDCCNLILKSVKLAKLLNKLNLSGTFFINHNSGYWKIDSRQSKKYVRFLNSKLKRIHAYKQEIGLHNDILGMGSDAKIEKILRDSISYLTKLNREKIGIVSHNSCFTYGFENSEIFKEFSSTDNSYPFKQYSAQEMGVKYDANFPIPRNRAIPVKTYKQDQLRDPNFLQDYFIENPRFERGYDFEIWLAGADKWIFADYNSKKVTHDLSSSQILDLDVFKKNLKGVILIHPEYVSKRMI